MGMKDDMVYNELKTVEDVKDYEQSVLVVRKKKAKIEKLGRDYFGVSIHISKRQECLT